MEAVTASPASARPMHLSTANAYGAERDNLSPCNIWVLPDPWVRARILCGLHVEAPPATRSLIGRSVRGEPGGAGVVLRAAFL
jgi:hypothetical protein